MNSLFRIAISVSATCLILPAFADGTNGNNSDSKYNTAGGTGTLNSSLNLNGGFSNTGFGYAVLNGNNQGSYNTSVGSESMLKNSSGAYNSAFGAESLLHSDGGYNTAIGADTLYSNTSGSANVAVGAQALTNNTEGANNVALGTAALYDDLDGVENTAVGDTALVGVVHGSYNIAVGANAGDAITNSSYNVDIANAGVTGDNGIVRIGSSGKQHGVYIQGIYGKPLNGSAVVINSNGQLGVVASSERYKTDVESMALDDNKLEQLRPVTFHLRSDRKGPLQYGLIAEEVDKVYPNLVIRNEKGRIDGVRYDELTPILLKQMQKQQRQIAQLEAELAQIHAALETSKHNGGLASTR